MVICVSLSHKEGEEKLGKGQYRVLVSLDQKLSPGTKSRPTMKKGCVGLGKGPKGRCESDGGWENGA